MTNKIVHELMRFLLILFVFFLSDNNFIEIFYDGLRLMINKKDSIVILFT